MAQSFTTWILICKVLLTRRHAENMFIMQSTRFVGIFDIIHNIPHLPTYIRTNIISLIIKLEIFSCVRFFILTARSQRANSKKERRERGAEKKKYCGKLRICFNCFLLRYVPELPICNEILLRIQQQYQKRKVSIIAGIKQALISRAKI